MKTKARQYTMTHRAESAAQTTEKILIATVEEFWNSPSSELRLQSVAQRSGVTVQTILRQFGNKENLLIQATKFESKRVQSARATSNVDTIESAVKQLVEHYEAMGDQVIRMLAEESRISALAEIAESGRTLHREWCRAVFAETLNSLTAPNRRVRLSQFVAICDVYMWKVLRRDSGLSAGATEKALLEILKPLVGRV